MNYIRDEKESLFNKLHLELTENKTLRKQLNQVEPKKKEKKGGLFGSFMSYFKWDDLETIDVTEGKVKKNVLIDKKDLMEKINETD